MQEAVARLKEVLGPDAVIQGTQRARDKNGSFVEITARPGVGSVQPPIQQSNTVLGQIAQGMSGQGTSQMPGSAANTMAQQPLARAMQQLGQMRGEGAYARTAQSTNPTLAAIVRAQAQPIVRSVHSLSELWLSAPVERERVVVEEPSSAVLLQN